jgi:ABC-type hemin transport system substrate-binding protein
MMSPARRDASDVEVVLPYRPSRIVSLVPSITEILFALALEDRIVAVTRF